MTRATAKRVYDGGLGRAGGTAERAIGTSAHGELALDEALANPKIGSFHQTDRVYGTTVAVAELLVAAPSERSTS